MVRLKDFAAMTAKPLNRSDNFAIDTRYARTVNAELERQRRLVGDMVPESVYDSWEASLVMLGEHRYFSKPRKGSGAAFAIGVTRDQALAAHAQLLQELDAFRLNANADLAALLHGEMQECAARYEQRRGEHRNVVNGRPVALYLHDFLRHRSKPATEIAVQAVGGPVGCVPHHLLELLFQKPAEPSRFAGHLELKRGNCRIFPCARFNLQCYFHP